MPEVGFRVEALEDINVRFDLPEIMTTDHGAQ